MGDSEVIRLLNEYISYSEKTKRPYVTIEVDILKNALNIICQKEALERLNILTSSLQKLLSKMSLGVEQAIVDAIKDFAERLTKEECENVVKHTPEGHDLFF